MKTMVMMVGAVLLMGIGVALAGDAPKEAAAVKKQTVCPIMGGAINSKIYVDAEGKRVYFCCGGCPAAFKKDPAKYIKAMEADGITLDKAEAAKPKP